MPQALAVRVNKSLAHHGKPLLNLTAPNAELLPSTPRKYSGRRIGVVTVYDAMNSFVEWPDNLWWKLATAKHDDFICQQFTHNQLMTAIEDARLPMDTLLQYSETIPSIISEHRFFIAKREVKAHSGYLKDGVTIYDGAVFSEEETEFALAKVEEILADEDFELPQAFVMDIAVTTEGAFILEYNPAWSSGWYDSDISGVLEVVKLSTNPSKKEMKRWGYQPDELFLSSRAVPLPLA